jgi:hypothetical protein
MDQTRALWLYYLLCFCCGQLPHSLMHTVTISLFESFHSEQDLWKWYLVLLISEALTIIPLFWYKGFWNLHGPKAMLVGQLTFLSSWIFSLSDSGMWIWNSASWFIYDLARGQIDMGTIYVWEGPVLVLVLLTGLTLMHWKLRKAFDPNEIPSR